MRTVLLALLLASALPACAASAPAADPNAAPGSLREEGSRARIPRPPGAITASADAPSVERYLNIRSALTPAFSASGRKLAFRTAITGQNQVWMLEKAGGWPVQLTFGNEPVSGFAWSPVDDDRLVFFRDVGGNERRQIHLLDVATGETRRLTSRDDVIHTFGGWSMDGRFLAWSSNERQQAAFDLYVMELATGRVRRILERDATLVGMGFAPDGKSYLAGLVHTPSWVDLWLVDLADTAAVRRLTPEGVQAKVTGASFTPDGKTVRIVTDRDREFLNRATIDRASGAFAYADSLAWDVETTATTDDGRFLAVVVNENGRGRLGVQDLRARSADRRVALPTLPDGTVSALAWSKDGTKLAFALSGPQHPSDVWVWDRGTNTMTRWTDSWTGGVPRASFVGSRLVEFDSFDGTRIAGYLYLPPGAEGKPVPVVFSVHGGPEEQSQATFSPLVQYFVRRGLGVYLPNVRGSTGYGKAFTKLDDVGKRLDSVRDLDAAAAWLVAQGIADPARIAVSGGSYGGYMTLAALAFHPDRFACGVSIVGISNLRTVLASTGAWRRHLRAAEYGDPEKDGAAIDAVSPIHRVDAIRSPLLVIQGANDPRVPQSESDQMVEALRKRGAPVEYLLYPDEGHGLAKLPNRITGYTRMADFFAEHLLAPPRADATP